MDWASVISSAIAGALAAGLASLFTVKFKTSRNPYVVVTVILFVGLQTLSSQTILPRIRVWQTDRQLRKLPFYRDLAEVDPETYEKMRVVVETSVQKREGSNVIASRLAPMVAATIPKYIGSASDDSVVAFIGLTTRQLEALRESNPEVCYYYMFPSEPGALSVAKYLNSKNTDDSLRVLGSIVESAIQNPQPLPDSAKVQSLLYPIVIRLQSLYGNDVELFQKKPTDAVGRQKVCALAISLYKDVQGLPLRDASLVLRYLLSQQKSSMAP